MDHELHIHQNHTVKAIIYFLFGLVLFFLVAGWVFFTYFYADFLNSYAIPKLKEAVITATDGYYRLSLDRIIYEHHKVYCIHFDLERVRFDSGAKGIALRGVNADTVQFTGVNILKILLGKSLAMTSIQLDSPKVYMTDLSIEKPTLRDSSEDSIKIVSSLARKLPAISFDSIVLRDIRLYLPGHFGVHDPPSYRGILFKLTDFYFNSETKEAQPVLFSKRVDIALPDVSYPIGDGEYSLQFKNLHGNSEDSTITADYFAYTPNYTEEQYTSRHRFASPMITFWSTGMRIDGMNFESSLSKANIFFRTFRARTWYLDSYVDRNKPDEPHPLPALLPNDIVSSLPMKVDIDSLILSNGKIRIREKVDGETGSIGFDNVHLVVSPVSKDTIPIDIKPAEIMMNALFLGEAPLHITAEYPLQEKSFNMDLHANLGSFDASRLNSALIPFVRLQVDNGKLQSAKVDMNIRSGVASTTVLPFYKDFKVTILPANPGKKSGILEKIKTIAARIFIIENDNPDENGKLKIGESTRTRSKDEAFMQFIWYALRKSLGKVIGGFQ